MVNEKEAIGGKSGKVLESLTHTRKARRGRMWGFFILFFIAVCSSGCWQYSDGKTVGFVTTVEGGIFWDTVFIRAELESSNSNGYAIRKDKRELKEQLLQSSINRERVEVLYSKHIAMARVCDDGNTCNNDEIISMRIVGK